MPNHLHLLLCSANAEEERWALGGVLSGFTRHIEARRIWEPLPEATPITDDRHLLRTVRYVHLNPCRDQLVADPLAWPWSTHRGVVGAEVAPWLSAKHLANIVASKRSAQSFVPWFHGYVSSDPSCATSGAPLPAPAPAREWPEVTLADVVSSAIAATPWSKTRGARRHVAALLAAHQGYDDAATIGAALGITSQMVRRLASRTAPSLLPAGRLCLGDPRLRLAPKHQLAVQHL